MIERNGRPVSGRVTVCATAFVVNVRLVSAMAIGADALRQMRVRDHEPVTGGVTVHTRARIVDGVVRYVARRAIREAFVIEPRLLPVLDDVAVGALAGIMVFGHVLFSVTRGAIVETKMVEDNIFPTRGVGVTADAGFVDQVFRRRHQDAARGLRNQGSQELDPRIREDIVLRRRVLGVARLALDDGQVIELRGFPAIDSVAAGTLALEVLRVNAVDRRSVAIDARLDRPFVCPVGVARRARRAGVAAFQRVRLVGNVAV